MPKKGVPKRSATATSQKKRRTDWWHDDDDDEPSEEGPEKEAENLQKKARDLVNIVTSVEELSTTRSPCQRESDRLREQIHAQQQQIQRLHLELQRQQQPIPQQRIPQQPVQQQPPFQQIAIQPQQTAPQPHQQLAWVGSHATPSPFVTKQIAEYEAKIQQLLLQQKAIAPDPLSLYPVPMEQTVQNSTETMQDLLRDTQELQRELKQERELRAETQSQLLARTREEEQVASSSPFATESLAPQREVLQGLERRYNEGLRRLAHSHARTAADARSLTGGKSSGELQVLAQSLHDWRNRILNSLTGIAAAVETESLSTGDGQTDITRRRRTVELIHSHLIPLTQNLASFLSVWESAPLVVGAAYARLLLQLATAVAAGVK